MKIDSLVDAFIAATVIPIITVHFIAVAAIAVWSLAWMLYFFLKD